MSGMEQKAAVVPGVSLAAVSAIKDVNVRQAVQSIVDMLNVRNGHAGSGDERFVTAREVGLVKGRSGLGSGGAGAGGRAGPAQVNSQDIARIVNDLQAQVMESPLFKLLGQHIELIDGSITQEITDRIAAVTDAARELTDQIEAAAQKAAQDLLAEAEQRGTAISEASRILNNSISALAETVSTVSAKTDGNLAAIQQEVRARTDADTAEAEQRTTLAARVGQAESAIDTVSRVTQELATTSTSLGTRLGAAESTVTTLNQTTASQAQSITSLGTRTTAAESSITTLNETTAAQATAATQLSNRVGQAETSIGSLQTASSGQATALESLSTSLGQTNAAVTSNRTARINSDNALASAVNTLWALVGNNESLVQTGNDISAGPGGSNATAWAQVQAALRDSDGALISSAVVRQETSAVASRVSGVETKWVVNLDSGGLATGYRQAGFGIYGSGAYDSPTYAFGVRADTFWIASPGETATANPSPAQVPFIVKTSPWVDSQGVQQPAGVYLNELFATSARIGLAQIQSAHIGNAQIKSANIGAAEIKSAHIGDAEVGTLKLAGQAVTFPLSARSSSVAGSGNNSMGGSISLTIASTGAPILVVASGKGTGFRNADAWAQEAIYLTRNGAAVWDASVSGIAATGDASSTSLALIDQPGVGTFTYTLTRATEANGPVGKLALALIETKR